MFIKVLLIVVGLSLVVIGIWKAFKGKSPMDTMGALAAIFGLAIALTAVLLTCVPDFFN